MMGFMSAVIKLIDKDAMRKAVEFSVPKGTQELNLKAFDMGFNYFTDKSINTHKIINA